MPSSYTHPVQAGKAVTLRDFAFLCARAFGPLIDFRDKPEQPVPQVLPADFKAEKQEIAALRQQLDVVKAMTDAQCLSAAAELYETEMASFVEAVRKFEQERHNYTQMLKKVKAWTPPERLVELKGFMEKQLTESLQFDCHPSCAPRMPERRSAEEWCTRRIKQLEADIANLERQIAGGTERATWANEWLKELWDAFPEEKQS